MTLAELVEAYHSGVVTGETYVWADGMDDWQPLSNVPEVVSALHGAGSGAAAAPAPAPEPAPVAARRDSGRNARGVDLFGGVAAAGSEHDMPAPPPSARGSSPPAEQLTGQRGEQSVLFSLNALTQAASTSRTSDRQSSSSSLSSSSSSSGSSGKTSEDSGLIDLGALAKAAAEQPAAASAPMLMPLGAPVLGSPMLEAPATAATTPPPAKSKTGLIIGIALFVGMLAIAGAIMFSKGKPVETPAAPSATAAATPTPTDTASAAGTAAAPTSTAVDPTAAPTASASAKVATGPAPVGGGKRPGGAAAPGGGKTPDSPPAAAPPPTPPKPAGGGGGGCGCAPGDLMCNIQCSAKKKK
jgi:hypothetical protein